MWNRSLDIFPTDANSYRHRLFTNVGYSQWKQQGMCSTCRKESNVVEEGVVDLEAVERVHASVIEGGNEDVLVALAAHAPPVTVSRYNSFTNYYVYHLPQ